MLNKICDELIQEILYFLTNEDLMENQFLNTKFYKIINDESFIDYILYRNHPLVFNKFDNYCQKCNLNLFILDDNTKYITCGHVR